MKSFFLSLIIIVTLSASWAKADETSDRLANGKASFDMHCARCHGVDAKGNGMDAQHVPVPPRNLTEGIIKFKSTESGTPPSDEDFMWILNHGLSHSGMPSFANLNMETKTSLIAYIKTLSPEYTVRKPVRLPLPDTKMKVDLNKGKEVYAKLQCAVCHGTAGQANGTSANTMVDSWKQPILPANLTQGWTYRAGNSPKEIYYRLMAGINGAPMPSYADAVSQKEEAWQLANYISSLQIKPNWSLDLVVAKHKGELPITAAAAAWSAATPTEVPLSAWSYSNHQIQKISINAVSVRAISNDASTAYKVQWSDPNPDLKKPLDSLMIAFKTQEFKAEGLENLHTLYTPEAPPMPMVIWKADRSDAVIETVSNLAGVIKSDFKSVNDVSAQAVYTDGLWTLVFVRSNDKGQGPISLGFAAWNGSATAQQSAMSVSKWVPLSSGESAQH